MATKRIDELPELGNTEDLQTEDRLPFWQSLTQRTAQTTWGKFLSTIFQRSTLRVNDQASPSEVPADHFGIEVDRGGNNPMMVWDNTTDQEGWKLQGHQANTANLQIAGTATVSSDLQVQGTTQANLIDAGATAYLTGNTFDNWGKVCTIKLTNRFQQEVMVLDLMAGNGNNGSHSIHRVALRVQQNQQLTDPPYFGGFSLQNGSDNDNTVEVKMFLEEDTSTQKTICVYASNPFNFSRLKYQIVSRNGTSNELIWNQQTEPHFPAADLPSGMPSVTISPFFQQTQNNEVTLHGDLAVTGTTTLTSAIGSTERMVTANPDGSLATQPIPSPAQGTHALLTFTEPGSKGPGSIIFPLYLGNLLAEGDGMGFIAHAAGTITQISVGMQVSGHSSTGDIEVEFNGGDPPQDQAFTIDSNGAKALHSTCNYAFNAADTLFIRFKKQQGSFTCSSISVSLLLTYQ